MEIVHRPGKSHDNADFLCRMPDPNDCGPVDISVPLRSLPCGECGHCTRVHRKWTEFSEDVDDVVPISVTARQLVVPSCYVELMISPLLDIKLLSEKKSACEAAGGTDVAPKLRDTLTPAVGATPRKRVCHLHLVTP